MGWEAPCLPSAGLFLGGFFFGAFVVVIELPGSLSSGLFWTNLTFGPFVVLGRVEAFA